MDDVHGAHRTAGVVEEPLLLGVDVARVLLVELGDDVVDYRRHVAAMGLDGARLQVAQVLQIENVELVEVLLHDVHHRRQERRQDAEDGQEAAHAAGGLRLRHCVGSKRKKGVYK